MSLFFPSPYSPKNDCLHDMTEGITHSTDLSQIPTKDIFLGGWDCSTTQNLKNHGLYGYQIGIHIAFRKTYFTDRRYHTFYLCYLVSLKNVIFFWPCTLRYITTWNKNCTHVTNFFKTQTNCSAQYFLKNLENPKNSCIKRMGHEIRPGFTQSREERERHLQTSMDREWHLWIVTHAIPAI